MSSFWANKLGGVAAPAAAPAPAPQQASTAPWWASPQAVPTPTAPAGPETVPQGQQRAPARAQVARQDTHCPDCGGDTFFKPVGNPNAMSQCYECGYNPRFQQSTAGLPSNKSTDATPAKQTGAGGARGQSNYSPGVFIKADGTTAA